MLTRIDVEQWRQMQTALAQHFAILVRDAAAGVDVNRRPESMRARAERLSRMRDVTPTKA